MEDNEILNIKELSLLLNISISKIRQLIYDDEIPFYTIGNRYYFIKKNIIQWIEEKQQVRNYGYTTTINNFKDERNIR